MTLSSLIGSLTRRDAPASPTPEAAAPASSPDVLAWLRAGTLRLAPATEADADLGALTEVRARIAEVLPGVAFDEAGRGAFTRTGYVVAFDTGSDDRVPSIGVQITGGVAALPPLQRLIAKTGWRLEAASQEPL